MPINRNSQLSQQVVQTLETYFETLGEEEASNLYQMVMTQVEAPLIRCVLERTDYNQTQAAQILGINRNTLRKKMKLYQLL
ncbi:helix-turn-helix domain-containing protein [Galenea microaerophila]